MFRRFSLVLAGLITILGLIPRPGTAANGLALENAWMLIPESQVNHPRHKVLTLVAQQKLQLVTCTFSYGHRRKRYITSLGESVRVKQPKGTAAEVTVELITRTASRTLGPWDLKHRGELVQFTLVDPSGLQEPVLGGPVSLESEDFPLKLKKNEALLFIFDFSNMPKVLGVKRGGGQIQYDIVQIGVLCETCGSNDSPCPGSE